MIEREFFGGEILAAVLALTVIARIDIATIEFDWFARQAVVAEQANDLWDRQDQARGGHPVMLFVFKGALELCNFRP